jgi:cell division protein FtsB
MTDQEKKIKELTEENEKLQAEIKKLKAKKHRTCPWCGQLLR